MQHLPKKILVIRNDKLGDFMLIFPALSLLKKAFPAAEIHALVPEYTAPMAELCPSIDHVVTDNSVHKLSNVFELVKLIKKYQFDAVIDFHPETVTGLAVFLSRIPHRFAPASRLVQVFYNRKLTQRRSYSRKPEFEYNTDLARFMIEHYVPGDTHTPAPPPCLVIPEPQRVNTRNQFYQSHHINKNKKLVVVHPGSGGSAITVALEEYAKLISLLGSDHRLHFVITAGPGEEDIAQSLSGMIHGCENTVHVSRDGIARFTEFLSIVDLFISGSTGVLHIAGALDIPTVAFYSSRQSATSLRWQTLNSNEKSLSFTSKDTDSSHIVVDMDDCYQQITKYLLSDSNPDKIAGASKDAD